MILDEVFLSFSEDIIFNSDTSLRSFLQCLLKGIESLPQTLIL